MWAQCETSKFQTLRRRVFQLFPGSQSVSYMSGVMQITIPRVSKEGIPTYSARILDQGRRYIKKKKNQSLPSKLDFAISTSANEPRKKRTRVNEIRWFIEEPVLEWNERNGARQDWKERRKIDPPLVSSATDACKYIPCTDRLINNSRAPVERCVQKKRKRLDPWWKKILRGK